MVVTLGLQMGIKHFSRFKIWLTNIFLFPDAGNSEMGICDVLQSQIGRILLFLAIVEFILLYNDIMYHGYHAMCDGEPWNHKV